MKIFVYGTLQSQFENEMAQLLKKQATFLCKGKVLGFLYLLDWYPGLVVDAEGYEVKGEVFEIHTDEELLLKKLDAYEGVDTWDYRRVMRQVNTKNGKQDCWIYETLIESEYIIKSGDFLDVSI